jgi:bifunctional non-homologous end joining protein LigD
VTQATAAASQAADLRWRKSIFINKAAGSAGPGHAADAEGWMSEVGDVLEQLESPKPQLVLKVEGHPLPVTNLDKILWPGSGRSGPFTKRDLLRYMTRVSPYLIPHLKGRPLFVTRYPNGVTGKSFYQKHWDNPPEFVRTVSIYSSHNEGDSDYIVGENLPTLLWLAQMAGLELHPWFSRVDPAPDARGRGKKFSGSATTLDKSVLNYPDFVVFDLDPYQYSGREKKGEEPELHRQAFKRTRDLALRLRELLSGLGLETFVKTSGRTGLHLYLPILRKFDYDTVRGMAETIGRYAAQEWPKDVTLEWAVERRTGKIFFDYNQNVRGKSLASIFSPRRHPLGTVSMPVRWEELDRVYPTEFTLRTAPDLLEKRGDPWAGILSAKHDIGALLEQQTAG